MVAWRLATQTANKKSERATALKRAVKAVLATGGAGASPAAAAAAAPAAAGAKEPSPAPAAAAPMATDGAGTAAPAEPGTPPGTPPTEALLAYAALLTSKPAAETKPAGWAPAPPPPVAPTLTAPSALPYAGVYLLFCGVDTCRRSQLLCSFSHAVAGRPTTCSGRTPWQTCHRPHRRTAPARYGRARHTQGPRRQLMATTFRTAGRDARPGPRRLATGKHERPLLDVFFSTLYSTSGRMYAHQDDHAAGAPRNRVARNSATRCIWRRTRPAPSGTSDAFACMPCGSVNKAHEPSPLAARNLFTNSAAATAGRQGLHALR